jgi:hypothetical protein
MKKKNSYQGGTTTSAINENVQILTGQKGDYLDKAITLRDLLKFAIITKSGSTSVQKINDKYNLRLDTTNSNYIGGIKASNNINLNDYAKSSEVESLRNMITEIDMEVAKKVDPSDVNFIRNRQEHLLSNNDNLYSLVLKLYDMLRVTTDALERANVQIAELKQLNKQ